MKPLHSEVTRMSRCPCCQSQYSKHNAKTSKHGNSAARLAAKRGIKRELTCES